MIGQLVPAGLKGLIAAALLAALMSTVSGALNSIATLFSYDIYKRWRPDASERSMVLIGKWVTFIGMIAAILWSPFVGHYKSLFQGLNVMICYIAPPITTVFIWGIFWRKASARAAQYTLYIGSVLGFVTFILDWFKGSTGWNVPFMMMAFYLFVICSVILVVLSLLKPDADSTKAESLTWANPMACLKTKGWPGLGDYRFLALLLFLIMVALYWIFG
jgi:SSS family solute:Na+ symporter